MHASPHVMVVEDNALVSGAMRVLFEETGHRVTTASSVDEAVAAATADRVDVMLLDLGLGDGNGLDVLARLGERHALPRVSVALTGRDEPEIIAACRAAGCRDALLKPVPARDLLGKVRGWLSEIAG